MSMRVTYYRQNKDKNNSLVAVFGLYLESLDLYFSGLKYVRMKNGGFVAFPPSEKYTGKDGKDAYQKYFWFGKRFSEHFQKQAHAAINAYVEEKKIEEAKPVEPAFQPQETQHYDNYQDEPNAELPF